MPKVKTNSGAKKRFRFTGTGKIKRHHAFHSHILTKKTKKQKRNLLGEGNKVRAYVFFRGRSILFKEQGEVLLLRFANDLEEYGKVEQMPRLEGKKMFLYMSPKKAGTAKKSQQKMDREKREAEAKAAADAEREANAEKNGLLANAKGGDALKKLAEGAED